MTFSSALFYPWIDIRDAQWLKTAALYWDSIQTIVPQSIAKPYESRTSKMFADEGVLRPLHVSSDAPEVEALTEDILLYIDSQEARDLFIDPYGTRQTLHADKLPYTLHRLSLNRNKLPYRLRQQFEQLGADGEWVDVEPEFGHFYMTLLATRLAESRGLSVLTSSSPPDRLAIRTRTGSAFTLDYHMVRRPRELAEGMLIDLALGEVSIRSDVPVQKIIRFRKQHSDELARMRSKLGELLQTVPEDRTVNALRQYVQDIIVNDVQPALSDLKAALEAAGLKTLTEGLLKVSFLSAAPTSALVATGFSVPLALAAGAGISLTCTGILLSVEKRKCIRENPFSYLLAVDRAFR